jgi:hypothetical protein
MLPGATQDQLDLLFNPFLRKLQNMNISYGNSTLFPDEEPDTDRYQPTHLWMYLHITMLINPWSHPQRHRTFK